MLTALLLMVGSCAHRVEKVDIPEDSNVTLELRKLETALNEARFRQVDLLSPDYFDRSESAFDEARSFMERQQPETEILDSVAYGVAYLEKAEEIANIARADLIAVLTAREKALSAEAQVYLPSKLNEIDKSLKNVAEEYERRHKKIKRASSKQMATLQNQYLELEAEAKSKN